MGLALALALGLLAEGRLQAQGITSAQAGLIYQVEGDVTLDGNRVVVKAPVDYPQMRNGQALRTGAGRAEILLGPSGVAWLASESQLHFEDTSVEGTLIVLDKGSAMVEVKTLYSGARMELRTPGATVRIVDNGVYSFAAEPGATVALNSGGQLPRVTLRVFGGTAVVARNAGAGQPAESVEVSNVEVKEGWELPLWDASPAVRFDRKAIYGRGSGGDRSEDQAPGGEFFHWAAFRSYELYADASRSGPTNWKFAGRGFTRHPHFDVEYRTSSGAAGLQYLTARHAGLLFYTEGNARASGGWGRPEDPLSPYLAEQDVVETRRGRAEVFLGQGVVARLNRNSAMRLLDGRPKSPGVALERGGALVEVARSAKNTRIEIRVGDTVTEITKSGIYQFDMDAQSLRVFDGEAVTRINDTLITTKSDRMLDLRQVLEPVKFDGDAEESRDGLFLWAKSRSLALYGAGGDVMTDWRFVRQTGAVVHGRYGSTMNVRVGRQRRR